MYSKLRFFLNEEMKFITTENIKMSRPPNGIELRPVTELHDFVKASSAWPHRNQNSLALFQRMGKFNINIGAFMENGTLAAWVFR